MDTRVWEIYLRSLLACHITKDAVLLVDNLDCQVSAASEAIVTDELGCKLQSLPKNATSVCQPLDVGKTAKDKRIETINRTIKAWESFKPKTIRSAFNKALLTNF
ncbi:hypothetical protein PHYSODRAFT_532947 [Phytophthora sojae]|uniref:DDE-1 domain-containing protein n=1 Tax=Phytophthora sojae (strain P6497) TaxID=1094619 RepID=G5AFN4_PHYSP|nr:hypothetical protein PHYSODRAFT_532947 [Phytophthora sojae]EGZ06024.1 hypothetical protein PHYSODRAFT_532947 [Phytophthora sojae]|eukprot:XP_009538885.1 hypothetical protein PHYSODRAFT_532947 [Phytophthora sojae]